MNVLNLRFGLSVILLALAMSPALAANQSGTSQKGKVYRWVDKNGQVHYGQSVPPEYAEQDRDVLNAHGVSVRREEGSTTPEEARTQTATDKALREVAQRKQRDRVLLQTYQSVEEINALRDRRLDLLDAQLTIQEESLKTLRRKHAQLKEREAKFKPINTAANAQPMPDGLSADIERSEADIETYEANLAKKREERVTTIARFESDTVRFKELKGQ